MPITQHFAIGDVQGCLIELKNLLQAIQFNPYAHQLWFCGDLVNRGPDSLGVMRYLMGLPRRPVVVLGNHDLHLLAVASGAVPIREKDTFEDILADPDREAVIEWLEACSLLHCEQGFVLVHAGILPAWTLKEACDYATEVEMALQADPINLFKNMYGTKPKCWDPSLTGWERLRFISNVFTRMRFCRNDHCLNLKIKSKPDKQAEGLTPWFNFPHRKTAAVKIIFGHWASLMGEVSEQNIYAMDTGCVWGERLTAMRLEDGALFSVPSERKGRVKHE